MSRWHTTEYDMLPERAFQPIGGRNNPFGKKMTLEGGGKGGGAPDPNPGMIASAQSAKETADAQREIAANSLAFYKQQYEEFKPLYDEIVQNEVAIANANQKRAEEYAQYERETFRPLEQKLVKDAYDYATEGRREQLASQAAADVSQAFGVARGQQTRQMAAAGLRPDSGRFAALNQNLLTQEALARAGAQNKARTDAENIGYARLQDAASLGRNLASNASTAYGVSLNASNSAGQNMQQSLGSMNQGYNTAIQANQGAIGGYGTAGNIYGQEFAGRMQGYQANQAAAGGAMRGIGALVGTGLSLGTGGGSTLGAKLLGFADGGKVHMGAGGVRGPGGPVDDKIPAMLSDGEYVLPADTVKAIGKKNIDKVVDKTHTPASVQRKRKALKGKK